MNVYWDSSALIAACQDEQIAKIFWANYGVTRSHTFAEVFSILTGGRLGFRVDADEASLLISEFAENSQVKDLAGKTVLRVLSEARSRGVRGGRVHDYLNAATAVRKGCQKLVTYNLRDFEGLFDELEIVEPSQLS